MKKYSFFIALTLLFAFQKRETISAYLFTPPDYSAAHDVDVLMYGTTWCGYCAKARRLLDENGISYFEYDIESSTEGYNQHKDLGGRGIPVFQVGGEVLKGYNPKKLLQLVDALSTEVSQAY